MNNPVPARLAALRAAMQQHGVAAVLVPSADPHLSEYLPAHWSARTWLSGFDGSAGTLIVGREQAGLWTDSRYFAQAEQQLAGSGVALMKLRMPHTPEHLEWLQQQLHDGDVLAVAGDSVAVATRHQIEHRLAETGATVRTDLDLPGEIWTDRPALPASPAGVGGDGRASYHRRRPNRRGRLERGHARKAWPPGERRHPCLTSASARRTRRPSASITRITARGAPWSSSTASP